MYSSNTHSKNVTQKRSNKSNSSIVLNDGYAEIMTVTQRHSKQLSEAQDSSFSPIFLQMDVILLISINCKVHM